MPARIAGYWRGVLTGPHGEEPALVEFAQRFQTASATVWLPHWNMAGSGHIRGEQISLSLKPSSPLLSSKPLSFTLHTTQDRLEGEAVDGGQRYVLRATRLAE